MEIFAQVRESWKEWEGDSACSWMNIAYQSDEFYKGLAAGKILIERHGRDYVLSLMSSSTLPLPFP